MWSDVFLIVTTVLALAYAHYAYRQSVRAPILRMSLLHPEKRKRVEFSTDPHVTTTVGVIAAEYRELMKAPRPEGALPSLRIPLVIANTGTKTARNVRLHIRYSALFGEVRSAGQKLTNTDGTEVMTIEHQVPDIHPKLSWAHEGDILLPRKMLFDGMSSEALLPTKDGIMMKVGWTIKMDAVIEYIVYAEDSEPVFQRCRVAPTPEPTSVQGSAISQQDSAKPAGGFDPATRKIDKKHRRRRRS